MVQRKTKPTVPPQVTYYLTQAGDDLIPMMTELCHWGTRHLGIPPNLPMMRRAVTGKATIRRAKLSFRKRPAA